MTADPFGTPMEQRRASVKWLASGARQTHSTYEPNRRCCSCRHHDKFRGYRCRKFKFSTQANAVCARFVKGLDS